jgi:hypothetical protein
MQDTKVVGFSRRVLQLIIFSSTAAHFTGILLEEEEDCPPTNFERRFSTARLAATQLEAPEAVSPQDTVDYMWTTQRSQKMLLQQTDQIAAGAEVCLGSQ